jgi:hypothetical protein
MARFLCSLVTAVWLALAGVAWAADPIAPGNYKFALVIQGQEPALWLLKLENTDGKITGSVLGNRAKVPPAKMGPITLKDGILRLTLELDQQPKITFEGKVPAEGSKKILGVFSQGKELMLAQLEQTKLTSLDSFELSKEILNQATPNTEAFDAILVVLNQAADKKVKVEDVRSWTNKVFKAAEPYGPTWQREMALKMAEVMSKSEEYAPVAVQYARQAERLIQPGDKVSAQQRALTVLAAALNKSGKADEAKEITARLEKLEAVTPTKFAGRKGKSDRAVLVELFTGAECPPCVAADLAFDALGKTFTPKDAILLQYHLHIPGPDPLTNADSVARRGYYREEIAGTPTIIFNGKAQEFGGGRFGDAQERYEEYVDALTPMLEKDAGAKLKVTATQKGSKITINAEASDVAEPGEKVRLRLALVEEEVNYKGGNKLAHHHYVVRALPGGAAGLPLKAKTGKQSVTVDLDELKKKLTSYLDEATKDLGEFPSKERPMDLKKLRVVAFIQDDANKEVVQAVQVPVTPE